MVLPLRTAWIAVGYFSQASLRGVTRQRQPAVGNLAAETGRDFVFGTTARLSDLSIPLTGEVRRSPEPSARPSATTDSESGKFVRRAY